MVLYKYGKFWSLEEFGSGQTWRHGFCFGRCGSLAKNIFCVPKTGMGSAKKLVS